MANTCNPLAVAEVVGREYIEAQMPSNDSYRVNGIFDNIRRINENVGGIDQALGKVATLHGPFKGTGELTALATNLFGDNAGFTQSIDELGSLATQVTDLVGNVDNIVKLGEQLTFQDVSTALMKGYLRNVDMLLPKGISDGIRDSLDKFPLFTEISEALGSLYYNLSLTDNALDLVDGIMQDVMDNTGLSTILSQDSLIKMIPEYAMNLHNNIRHLQWLGMRILPPCTYGKIFNKMDAALTHMYDLAGDALFFTSILDNRKVYLKALLSIYGDLLKKVENYFPICHQYSINTAPKPIEVGGRAVMVNALGNSVGGNGTDTTGVKVITPPASLTTLINYEGMTDAEAVSAMRENNATLDAYNDSIRSTL